MKKPMVAAVFLAAIAVVSTVGVVAFKVGESGEGISVMTKNAASSVVGVVWGFLNNEAKTGWMEFARFGSWLVLFVGVTWGAIGTICVYLDKNPFPSLIGHIRKAAYHSIPVWVVICIPVVAPFEGVARFVCGMFGITVVAVFGAAESLMTFDLKRLVRR